MRIVATLLLAALAGWPLPAPAAEYLFTNGTLLTFTEQGPVSADLRVVSGRIAEIGPELAPGQDAEVIDMAEGFLLPGLAEMHGHVPSPDQGVAYRDDVLFLWLANGITTVRGMLGDPAHLILRDDLAAHRVLGPRLITSGPSFNGNSVSSAAQARQMVRDQAAAGYDFLKIHPGLSLAEYDAMAEAADAADMPFAGHVPADVGLRHVIDSGQTSIDHLDGFMEALATDGAPVEPSFFGVALAGRADLTRLPEFLQAMQRSDIWAVPTETLIDNFANADEPQVLVSRPETVYLPEGLQTRYETALAEGRDGAAEARRALAVRADIIAAMQAAGVGLLLGSDSPQIFNVPGFSIHRELAAMVAAGLSPAQALEMGTTAPARYFGLTDEFGALRAGLAADLVLLEADPTADIANSRRIRGVMVRGRWLDREALDAGLAEIVRGR